MAEVFDYVGKVEVLDPTAVSADVFNEWLETLKAERSRILTAITTRISDENAFKKKLAEPSADGFAEFVNPNYALKDPSFIKLKQRIKILRAYPDYINAVQNAFSESGAFLTNIDLKKDKFRTVRYTLSVLGNPPATRWGPLPKAILFMTGDKKVLQYITSADSYTGTPTNVMKAGYQRYFRNSVMPIGVQGAVLAQYAIEIGDATLRDNVITKTNDLIAGIVNALYNSTDYTNVYLKLEYDTVEGKLRFHSHAESVA